MLSIAVDGSKDEITIGTQQASRDERAVNATDQLMNTTCSGIEIVQLIVSMLFRICLDLQKLVTSDDFEV